MWSRGQPSPSPYTVYSQKSLLSSNDMIRVCRCAYVSEPLPQHAPWLRACSASCVDVCLWTAHASPARMYPIKQLCQSGPLDLRLPCSCGCMLSYAYDASYVIHADWLLVDATSVHASWYIFHLHAVVPGLPGSRPLDIQRPDGVWIKVWPILGQVEGDIPFLAKLTNSIGHNGSHACYHCALEGTWVPSAGTNRCALNIHPDAFR